MTYSNVVLFALICFMVLISGSSFAQEQINKKYHPDYPNLFRPTSHDPNFKNFPAKSFYQSRGDWQHIIDSTWGPGLPLSSKLQIFNTYANSLGAYFDGFLSLGLDPGSWENLRTNYFNQIGDSTSRGAFSAIMSHLARDLRDAHTSAYDEGVMQTPLNPGVPLLMISGFLNTINHFGAVITALPDSNLLVLRTVPNHPLNLQPGDIILGYEGVPWKYLVHDLLNAGLPFLKNGIGAESADSDALLLGAGMNWHLFEVMDVIEYATGDTLHLPVAPMINLNVPPMLNNEQMGIPGIPFPDFFNGQVVSYGILNNTNIGYIYLYYEWPTAVADAQFAQAVSALQHTEGLIIDMRINGGGWALFDEAFDILFNDFTLTIEDAYRESPSPTNFNLLPSGNAPTFQIDADPASLYDHPIAVFLGPTCLSMGDLTAQRFRYHPTVRFFGKPPAASLGDNTGITGFQDWYLRYSFSDMFHVNQPGSYLNRVEFPIDYPVWHNPDDVANGIDAVVDAAVDWMNNLVYAHDLTMENKFYSAGVDTVHIEALVENPNLHPISCTVYLSNLDSTFTDSIRLFREMTASDAEIWSGEGLAPSIEDNFRLSTSAYDSLENEAFLIRNVDRFTTIGPVVVDHYQKIYSNQNNFKLQLFLRNDGLTATATDITVEIETADTNVTNITQLAHSFGNIDPGQIKSAEVANITAPNNGASVNFGIHISSEGWHFWDDDTTTILGLAIAETNIPLDYALRQNYPNPFNPTTNIEFSIPKSEFVTLRVYNILGEEVATLVSEKLSAGRYKYDWDASSLASGVYLYRVHAGTFQQIKKMILIK